MLTLALAREIEARGNHWVSEVEGSRHIQWPGQWRQVDEIAAELRQTHPESFRPVQVRCRNGETKSVWAFTKVVRLKRYGRKRLVIVHEQSPSSTNLRRRRSEANGNVDGTDKSYYDGCRQERLGSRESSSRRLTSG